MVLSRLISGVVFASLCVYIFNVFWFVNMTKSLPLKLQCICYITTAKLFAELSKQVSNDTSRMYLHWSDFPDLARSSCQRQVYLNTDFTLSLKTQLRYQKQAGKLGSDFAISLLKEAGELK